MLPFLNTITELLITFYYPADRYSIPSKSNSAELNSNQQQIKKHKTNKLQCPTQIISEEESSKEAKAGLVALHHYPE